MYGFGTTELLVLQGLWLAGLHPAPAALVTVVLLFALGRP